MDLNVLPVLRINPRIPKDVLWHWARTGEPFIAGVSWAWLPFQAAMDSKSCLYSLFLSIGAVAFLMCERIISLITLGPSSNFTSHSVNVSFISLSCVSLIDVVPRTDLSAVRVPLPRPLTMQPTRCCLADFRPHL